MSRSALELRPFRPGDEVDIEAGFARAFGKLRSHAEWEWKFPPLEGQRTIAVARDATGALVAHYAARPALLQRPERRFLAGEVVDVFTLAKAGLFRRSGPLTRTIDAFLARFCGPGRLELLYGFPSLRAAALGRATEVYPAEAPVPRRRRDPSGRLARTGFARFAPRGFDHAAIDRLWSRAARRYPWSAVRDADWHRRRFLARPDGNYRHLSVRQGAETRAIAVLRPEGARLCWVDLVWDGQEPEDLVLLESEVRREARAAGADEIELWLGGDPLAGAILDRLGWPGEPHPDLLLVTRSFVADASHREFADRLYLTLADSDLA